MAYNQDQSTVALPSAAGSSSPGAFSQSISTRGPFQVETYKGRQSFVVGIVLIIVGVLAVVFNIVELAISSDIYTYNYCSGGCIGHGFWGGILTIITGILAVVTGKNRTRCMITAVLVLAIITMFITACQTILAAIAATALRVVSNVCVSDRVAYRLLCSQLTALMAMESLIALMGGTAFFLCLWASVLCCNGNSCCAGTPGVTYAVVTTGRPQMTVITQQQYGQYDQPDRQQQYPVVYNSATGSYSYGPAPHQQYMAGPPSYNNVMPTFTSMSSPAGYPTGYDDPPAEESKY